MTNLAQITVASFDGGSWQMERVIDDARTGQSQRFSGHAVLQEGVFREVGVLHLDTGPLAASRQYLWSGTGQGLHIAFDDGRPFHDVDLSQSQPQATHHCDPDLYRVAYDFRAWPDWQATWAVTGPRKDYKMITCYRKQPHAALAKNPA